jgi:VanZ family protein
MPGGGEPAEAWPRILLGGTVILVLAVGLFPFEITPGARQPLLTTWLSPGETVRGAVRDVLANVLLFALLGPSISALARRRGVPGALRFLIVLLGCLALSLAVEGMQALLPSRDPTLRDVAANTLGGLLGMLPSRSGEERLAAMSTIIARRWQRLWPVRRPVPALGLHVTVLLLAAALLQTRTQLSNWDPSFPLVLGNEATGDRPWSGDLLVLEIADRALRPDEVAAAFPSSLAQVVGPLVVSAHFQTARSLEHAPADFSWHGSESPAARFSDLGLWLSGRGWLRSDEAGHRVTLALRRTNQFTLKLVCRSADPAQDGPARVVSISADPYHRNLTLGQEGSTLVARLRTPLTGANGRAPELVRADVFGGTTLRTILVTYDGSTLTVFVDSPRDSTRLELSPGAAIVGAFAEPAADNLRGYQIAFLAVVVFPAGFLFTLALRRGPARGARLLLPIAGFSVTIAAVLELLLVVTSGRAAEPEQVLVSGVLSAGGGLAAWFLE